MADTMTPEQRHRCMAAIKGKNTKPELMVRRYLHALGLRYSLHSRRLPGKPDLVFTRLRTVIFVNGCFWHGHDNCHAFKMPKSRTAYWTEKIGRNRRRDAENIAKLQAMGWNVIVVWECQLRTVESRIATLYPIGRQLLDLRDGTVSAPAYIPADCPEPIGYTPEETNLLPLAAEDSPTYGKIVSRESGDDPDSRECLRK